MTTFTDEQAYTIARSARLAKLAKLTRSARLTKTPDFRQVLRNAEIKDSLRLAKYGPLF